MEIAGAIFWIIAGLCYIVYKSYQEQPQATDTFAVLFMIIFSVILAFSFTVEWLIKVSITAAWVFISVVVAALIIWGLSILAEQEKKQEAAKAAYDRVMAIVNAEEYTDDELKEYGKIWKVNAKDGWRFGTDGERFAAVKPRLIEDYRKNVRYFVVSRELRERGEAERLAAETGEASQE